MSFFFHHKHRVSTQSIQILQIFVALHLQRWGEDYPKYLGCHCFFMCLLTWRDVVLGHCFRCWFEYGNIVTWVWCVFCFFSTLGFHNYVAPVCFVSDVDKYQMYSKCLFYYIYVFFKYENWINILIQMFVVFCHLLLHVMDAWKSQFLKVWLFYTVSATFWVVTV